MLLVLAALTAGARSAALPSLESATISKQEATAFLPTRAGTFTSDIIHRTAFKNTAEVERRPLRQQLLNVQMRHLGGLERKGQSVFNNYGMTCCGGGFCYFAGQIFFKVEKGSMSRPLPAGWCKFTLLEFRVPVCWVHRRELYVLVTLHDADAWIFLL